MLPEYRHHFEGLELVDSFITNGHKWLLTNFDCSCMWVRNAEPLKAALSLTPAYLRGKGNDLDYKVTCPLIHLSIIFSSTPFGLLSTAVLLSALPAMALAVVFQLQLCLGFCMQGVSVCCGRGTIQCRMLLCCTCCQR